MASNRKRPGRTLTVFGLVVAAMYGLVALTGAWTPTLGLDLQGGTRITLEASTRGGQDVTPQKLDEAKGIIDRRVNGSGVTEADVTTQGSRNIVVEIPGENRKDLVDSVKQTAQLRFRLVAGSGSGRAAPSPSQSGSSSPSGTASPGGSPAASPSGSATPRGRALPQELARAGGTTSPSPKASASGQPSPSAGPTKKPSQPTRQGGAGAPVDQPLKWMDSPGRKYATKFASYTCPKPGSADTGGADSPDQPLIACDDQGRKYLLSSTVIKGTQISDASAGIPQNQVDWVVQLDFDSSARDAFARVTKQLAGTGKQFAIVLDGKVISAPTVTQPILGGRSQISGNFTQERAQSLANSLKYGALPLRFSVPVVSEQGPTLAADQLSAGITAGVAGLLLVMVYCLLYYRGLGLVVIGSLMVAAGVTYAAVLLLSEAAGFTLTLPGIAGLIVAVGITADSFVVYFERIRDEMRDGRTMRVAVETGWARARATCLAADAVSLLAAVVLYIFAIGVVKGFAFALGISTAIDLLVFFFFTKPSVTLLATRAFFNRGHRLSGLDAEHLGVDHLPGLERPRPAGGRA